MKTELYEHLALQFAKKEHKHRDNLEAGLLEETHEVIVAAERGTRGEYLDELGDVLLQVVFNAMIAEKRGAFTFDDVVQNITDKLVRRYPTILGDEPNTLRTAEEIIVRWNVEKEKERRGQANEGDGMLDGVPTVLPGLLRA